MGRIIHGNKSFGYAPILTSDGVNSFGTPVMLEGMVSANVEVEQSNNNVYADDKTYCVIKGAKVRTAEVGLRYIDEAYAQYLGYYLNENGMLTDTGDFPNHVIFFETEEEDCESGLSTTTLHYLYNVKASTPTVETTTDEEDVEASTLTVSYSAQDSSFVTDDKNEYVQYGYIIRTEENAEVYDTFKQTVLLPTTNMTPAPEPEPEPEKTVIFEDASSTVEGVQGILTKTVADLKTAMLPYCDESDGNYALKNDVTVYISLTGHSDEQLTLSDMNDMGVEVKGTTIVVSGETQLNQLQVYLNNGGTIDYNIPDDSIVQVYILN